MRNALLALALATLALPAFANDTLAPGKPVQGQLTTSDRPSDSGGRSKDFTLRLQQGQLVAITAKSTDFDTIVILFKPNGELLADNDDQDGGESTDSLLVTTAPESGEYTLRLNSFAGEATTGAYTLRASLIDN